MATAFRTAQCKGCGKPIVWAMLDGKPIPLDPRPPIYRVERGDKGTTVASRLELRWSEPQDKGPIEAMVSHFATCSKAAAFSGSKPRDIGQGQGG